MRKKEQDGCVIKPCAELTWQDVNGDLVAINVDSGEYHIFNDVGHLIWLAIAEGKSNEEIVKQIIAQYNVREEKALSDLRDFIDDLMQRKLIEKQVS